MYLIIGLGNPGLRYAATRHNVGFMAVEAMAAAKGLRIEKSEREGLTADFFHNGEKVKLVKPQTYMNASGRCVRQLVDYYDVPLSQVLVIYDDIDLALGNLRIRKKGGAGTHNGMRSIVTELGSGDFPRIRFGTGMVPPQWDLADFVLAKMDPDTAAAVDEMCREAVAAAEAYLNRGIDYAMNQFNHRAPKQADDGEPRDRTGEDGNHGD
jgi:PTH1 family peptidyl-tRNA hydrolase